MREKAEILRVSDDADTVDWTVVGMPVTTDWETANVTPLDVTVVRVKMREFGGAISARRSTDPKEAEAKLLKSQQHTFEALSDSCKTLFVGKEEPMVVGPATDFLNRSQAYGWRARYGSPEMDYFERMFTCHRRHDLAPATYREAARNLWAITKAKIKRLSKRQRDNTEWEDDYRDRY